MDGQQRVGKPGPDTSELAGQRGVEGELNGRAVENPQVEGRGMVSGISRPFTSVKNLFARKVYTSQEVELRADRQQLENPRASDADRAGVLDDLRSKLEGGDKLSDRSEKELLRMAGDTKIRPEDRLEIIDMLTQHFDAPFPDALLDGLCRLLSQGVETGEASTKLMGVVAFVTGNETSDPPTRRELTILSKMAKSLEKCPTEKRNPAVVINVCRSLDRIAQDPSLAGAHAKEVKGALRQVMGLYGDIGDCKDCDIADRSLAAKQLLKMSASGRYLFEVSLGRVPESVGLRIMGGILNSESGETRMQYAKDLLLGEDSGITQALIHLPRSETRSTFMECLLDIVSGDSQYSAEHRDTLNSLFVGLNQGGDRRSLDQLAFGARYDMAFARNEQLSLPERRKHENEALQAKQGILFLHHPDDMPEDIQAFADTGGVVLRACVDKLGDTDAHFSERLEAFKLLKEENKIGTGPNNTLRGSVEACRSFLSAALEEGNRSNFTPAELLELCSYSSDVKATLLQLVGCEDVALNAKELVTLAAQKLSPEDQQSIFEALIGRKNLSIEDRAHVVKQGVDVGNEKCRMELSRLRRKANMSDTPIADRFRIAEALLVNGFEDVGSIYTRISMDETVDIGSRIEAFKFVFEISRPNPDDVARFVELLIQAAQADELLLSPRAMVRLLYDAVGERAGDYLITPLLEALVVREELTVSDRVYIAARGVGLKNEACRMELTKLKQKAFDSETPPSVRMSIAQALEANREQGARGIYTRLIDDESVDVMTRIRAAKKVGRDGEARVASLLVEKLLSDDLSSGIAQPAATFRALVSNNLLSPDQRQKIADRFIVLADQSSDPRIKMLLPIFYEGFSRQDDPYPVYEQVMAVIDSDEFSMEEKYVLAFAPMAKIAGADKMYPDSPAVQKFLELGRQIFSDPSALPEGFLSQRDLRDAAYAMSYAADSLRLPEGDIHREVINDLKEYEKNAAFMQRRAQSAVHNPVVVGFSGEGVEPLNVRWNPGYIAKPLPKPDVPDVSYQDFQDWAAAYEAEVRGSDAALAEMKLMTDSRDIGFFMGDAKRKEFETYLDPSRVEGSFIDSKALALRRVVAHAQTLSDVPEEGEAISPRGKLFQQLLVNCRTCSTGFMDAVVVVDREISSESVATDAGFTEAGMQEQRKADAFTQEYYQASVERRQKLLDGDSVFTRTLAGEDPAKRLNQPVHQSWAVDGVLGKRVGVHIEGDRFEVDEYALRGNNVNKKLYNADPQAALDMFYQHYDVKTEVAHFKALWNEQMTADLDKAKDSKVVNDASFRLQVLNGKAEKGALTLAEQDEREALTARDLSGERKAIEARPSYGTFEKVQAFMGTGAMNEIFDYDYDDDTDEDIYTLNDRGVAMILMKMGALEAA